MSLHNPVDTLPLWAQRATQPKPHGRVTRSSRAIAHQATQGIGSKAGSQVSRIYSAILAARHDGMTRPELCRETGIPINCICARVGSLLKAGKIGEPITMNALSPRRIRDGAHVLVASPYLPTDD